MASWSDRMLQWFVARKRRCHSAMCYEESSMRMRQMTGLALSAALASGGFVFNPLGAQTVAPSTARVLPVTANLRGAPPTGSHAVVIEHDQALATHTIYRPATL